MSEVGYFGVIAPNHGICISMSIREEHRAKAELIIKTLRQSSIIDQVGLTEMQEPDVTSDPREKQLIGALCATIVDGNAVETVDLGVLGMCIYILINKPFFWIEGEHRSGGVLTRIGVMDGVEKSEDAIDFFKAVPLVNAMLKTVPTFVATRH